MKVMCPTHGAHFPDDFRPRCPIWELWGLKKLTTEDKRKVWDWVFALDIDAIAIKYNIDFQNSFHGVLIKNKFSNWFVDNVPGYTLWTEAKRKKFQQDFFQHPDKYKPKKELNFFQRIWNRLIK